MNKYYAKILFTCNTGAPAHQTILHTWAENEAQAELKLDNLIAQWDDVEAYWIMKLSTQPIHIDLYAVEILVEYPRKTNLLNLRIKLEKPEEASEVFKSLSEDWNNVQSFYIAHTQKVNHI